MDGWVDGWMGEKNIPPMKGAWGRVGVKADTFFILTPSYSCRKFSCCCKNILYDHCFVLVWGTTQRHDQGQGLEYSWKKQVFWAQNKIQKMSSCHPRGLKGLLVFNIRNIWGSFWGIWSSHCRSKQSCLSDAPSKVTFKVFTVHEVHYYSLNEVTLKCP